MKKFFFLLGFLCPFFFATAQNRTVTGRVTDAKGNPLANVSVAVKGSTIGTTTKIDGTYSLTVPANARTLVFTSINMSPEEAPINSSTISVRMSALTKSMDEVIVVAYGTVKKSDFTGSANQTSYADFKNRPIINPLNAIVATGPGVQTTAGNGAPGSSPDIRVRGFGSIGASDGPLIVVDGVAYDAGLANLNTEDIETITTLKDAATVALWGSRASNGVVMITTKRGKKNKNSISFKILQGVSTRGLPEYDRVDAFQYYPLMWEALRNSLQYTTGQTAATASQNATNGIKTQLGYNPFNVPNNDIVRTDGSLNPATQLLWPDDLDWNKELVRTGSRQEYVLSYSGGNDKSDYFGSFGYINEKGFIIRSDWRRFSGRLNVNTQPLSWFKTGLNTSAVINNSNRASDGSSTGFVNPFFFTRTIGPIYPVYAHNQTTGDYLLNATGNRFYDYGNFSALGLGIPNRPSGAYPGRHTIEETKLNKSFFKRNTISSRGYASVIFTPWLKLTSNITVDLTDLNSSTYENTKVGDGAPAGRASKTNDKTISYTFNQIADFEKRFGDHHIVALAGHENYDYTFNRLSGQRQGQVLEGSIEFPNFSTINSLNSREDKYRIESYLSRLNYDFDGKYFLSANFRRDGNSRFFSDVRWENFWGVGIAWSINKEKFMNKFSWINSFKLRSSYGQLGNDGVLSGTSQVYYAYQALYDLGFNNATESGALQSQLANPQLTWESSNPFDIGIDFGLFKNRVRGSVEYYNREISGLIFNIQQPLSNGGFLVPTNVGNMYNRGVEIEIGGDVITKKNFNWEMKINASTIKNRITKMPVENPEVISGTKKLSVGHSIFDYWLREWYGVDPADGVALFRATSYIPANSRLVSTSKGMDTVTTDINNAALHYNGSAIPKLFGGIENTFRYKGFELSFLLQYQIGGKVYDDTYAELMHPGDYGSALHVDALKRWQSPGDITNVPRMQNSALGIYDARSDRWLTDASFLNIRSITFSYELPKSLVSRINAQDANFFIGSENVYLFSKRKGMNVNQAFTGVTSNVFTPARIITSGLTINF
ncbi:MAG TPA: SusC/RagA family TonB-linked outer membrane protein [Chitinophagaceae bacterium]|nr:SusC/RagA family TonB-linked outer membrane protein [Chitinophagaceae bacterium]